VKKKMSSCKPRPNPFDDLQDLLEEMEVPKDKRANMKWLVRNLPIHYSHHNKLEEAEDLLSILIFAKKLPLKYKHNKE